jgi:hypothetical protein
VSESAPVELPTLIVTGGPLDGRTVTLAALSSKLLIGSRQGCSLRLELGNVDPIHARVTWDPSRGILLADSGTATGTYVNGERISGEQVLKDGDRIFLGPPGSKQTAKLLARVPDLSRAAAVAAANPPQDDTLNLVEANGAEAPPLVLDGAAPAHAAEAEATRSKLEATWTAPAAPMEPRGLVPVEPKLQRPPEPSKPAPTPGPLPLKPPPPASSMPTLRSGSGSAPAAAPARSAPVAPSEPRKRPRPDHAEQMPSLASGDSAEPISVPAGPRSTPRRPAPQARRRPAGPRVSRTVLIAAGGGVLALVALWGYFAMQQPPPVLQSVLPARIEGGQAVTIKGTGFPADAAKVAVRFGDKLGQVLSANAQQIVARSPVIDGAAGVVSTPVVVEVRGARSNALRVQLAITPVLSTVKPDVAMPGDEVMVIGHNIAGPKVAVFVQAQPSEVVEANASSIRFRVPSLPVVQGTQAPITVQVGTETSRPLPLLIGKLPLVVSVSPGRGQAGEHATVVGRGFDPSPTGDKVTFGGQPALILSATETELKVVVPAVGTESHVQAPVAVSAKGSTSSSEAAFVVTRAATGAFIPRYFAAPVTDHPPHDHVFVSTELGPVLLLSDKADAPSTAERADRVATALNRLTETATAGQAIALETRDKPTPAVGVTGRADVVVTATAADAAAYDEPWDAAAPAATRGAPPHHTTPAAVAAYWTALLRDYTVLFVQRERPFHVLELSPRGHVFAEIYGEASRRQPGQGVPASMMSPLPAGTAQAFRDAALLLPVQGPARAGAAVEGRWQGTMEEGEAGTRAITVVLRADGGKLGGSFTTTAGQLAVDVPLRDATYQAGTLRFAAAVRGAPKYFVGTVDGATINGSIHPDAGSKDSVGRFTLRFAE